MLKAKNNMKNNKTTLVFLVDDDAIFLKVLEIQFKEKTNFNVKTFSTGEDCINDLSEKPDIIFLDYNLNSSNTSANNGLQILTKIKKIDKNIQVVMMSSQDRMEVAVNCMRNDAFDYIVKGESAFIGAQKAISVLFYQNKLMKELSHYKSTSIVLIAIVGILIIALPIVMIYFPEVLNR